MAGAGYIVENIWKRADWSSPGHRFKKDAPRIQVPVLFHMQWGDELFSRESQCELYLNEADILCEQPPCHDQ